MACAVKPRIVDAMWDDTILRDMGRTFHEPLLNWSDDVKDYFNTLPLHPSEYWTSCVVWETPHAITEAPTHGGVSFISEHRVLLGSDVEVPSHEESQSHRTLASVLRTLWCPSSSVVSTKKRWAYSS